MKIDFNNAGGLTIKPESSTERYALQEWARRRSSETERAGILLDLTPPPVPPSPPADGRYIKVL